MNDVTDGVLPLSPTLTVSVVVTEEVLALDGALDDVHAQLHKAIVDEAERQRLTTPSRDCLQIIQSETDTWPSSRRIVAYWLPPTGQSELRGGPNDGEVVEVGMQHWERSRPIPTTLRLPARNSLPTEKVDYKLTGFRNGTARWVYDYAP